MKFFAFFFCARVIGSFPGSQTSAQTFEATQLFDAGNADFTRGAYAEALVNYHRVLSTGFTSGTLYHNMGSAYFRLDEVGQAIRYYEKARHLLGDDPQLMHNLAIVQARVSSPFSQLAPLFWQTWWRQLFVRQGWKGFFWMGAVLYLLAAFLYGHRIWTRRRSAWHRRVRAATLLTSILLLLIGIGISSERARTSKAAIIESGVQISEISDTTGTLAVPEGVVVDVLGKVDESVEIRLPNGVRGYVSKDVLGAI